MPATSPPGSGRRRSTAERRDRGGADLIGPGFVAANSPNSGARDSGRSPSRQRGSVRQRRSGAAPDLSVDFFELARPPALVEPGRERAVGAANCCTNFARNSQRPIRFLRASKPEDKSIALSISLKRLRQSNVSHVALPLNLGTFPGRPRRNAGNQVLSSLRLTPFINWRILPLTLWDMVSRGWENFLARPTGPWICALFVQPTVAGLLTFVA